MDVLTRLETTKCRDGAAVQPGVSITAGNEMPPGSRLATMQELVEMLVLIKERRAELKALEQTLSSNMDAIAIRLGAIMSAANELDKHVSLADGRVAKVKCSEETYVSVKSDQKDLAYAYLLAAGYGGAINMYLNPATIKSSVVQLIESEGAKGPGSVTEFVEAQQRELARLVVLAETIDDPAVLPEGVFSIHTASKAAVTHIK